MANWSLKRLWLAVYHKIVGEKATPEYIARGWALGIFCGCALPFGGQLAISIPLSFVCRASKVGATLGTFITNYFTIFFIYPFQCWVGNRILGGDLTLAMIRKSIASALHERSWEAMRVISGEIVRSFFCGGLLFALVFTPITYYLVKWTVQRYQERMTPRIRQRMERRAKRGAKV